MSVPERGGDGADGPAPPRADRGAADVAARPAPPRAEDPKSRWGVVRRGGRAVFHLIVTTATVLVCVVGESIGNLAFRGGHDLLSQAVDAAVFGVLAGNLLAWWLWARQESRV